MYRRSRWTSLNFYVYAWPFIYWLYFIYVRKFYVRSHGKMRRQWKSTLRVVLVRSHVTGPKGILVNQQGGSETSGKPISRITLLCPITAHAANLGMITHHADNFGPITRHGKPLCHPVDWVLVMSSDLGCESHSVCSNPDFVNVHFEHDLEATK